MNIPARLKASIKNDWRVFGDVPVQTYELFNLAMNSCSSQGASWEEVVKLVRPESYELKLKDIFKKGTHIRVWDDDPNIVFACVSSDVIDVTVTECEDGVPCEVPVVSTIQGLDRPDLVQYLTRRQPDWIYEIILDNNVKWLKYIPHTESLVKYALKKDWKVIKHVRIEHRHLSLFEFMCETYPKKERIFKKYFNFAGKIVPLTEDQMKAFTFTFTPMTIDITRLVRRIKIENRSHELFKSVLKSTERSALLQTKQSNRKTTETLRSLFDVRAVLSNNNFSGTVIVPEYTGNVHFSHTLLSFDR